MVARAVRAFNCSIVSYCMTVKLQSHIPFTFQTQESFHYNMKEQAKCDFEVFKAIIQ